MYEMHNDCTTLDTCNETTTTCIFEEILLSSCIECGAYIFVEVETDDNYRETKWEIIRIDNNNNNMLVLSSQSMFEENQLYTKEKCLSPGKYEYTIFDAGGDGLSDGGYYKVFMNDEVIISGGQTFQNKESTTFEISTNIPSSTSKPSGAPTIVARKKKQKKNKKKGKKSKKKDKLKQKKKSKKKKKKSKKKKKKASIADMPLEKKLAHRFPRMH